MLRARVLPVALRSCGQLLGRRFQHVGLGDEGTRRGEVPVGALKKAVNVQERNAAVVRVGAAQVDRNA
jgi:hypothetical protein